VPETYTPNSANASMTTPYPKLQNLD